MVAGYFVQPNEGGEIKVEVVLRTAPILQLVNNKPFAQARCLYMDATHKLIC